MPWTAEQFRDRHNHEATLAEAKVGATEANRILSKSKDEGLAVRKGNAAILAYRVNKAKSRKR